MAVEFATWAEALVASAAKRWALAAAESDIASEVVVVVVVVVLVDVCVMTLEVVEVVEVVDVLMGWYAEHGGMISVGSTARRNTVASVTHSSVMVPLTLKLRTAVLRRPPLKWMAPPMMHG